MSYIEHTGKVVATGNGVLLVQVEQVSACAACHAKGLCTASERADKVIEVVTDEQYEVGERVMLFGQSSMGLKAVLLAYVLPFVLIVAVLALMQQVVNEAVAGIVALGTLIPYFFVLRCCRHMLQRKFTFKVMKLN